MSHEDIQSITKRLLELRYNVSIPGGWIAQTVDATLAQINQLQRERDEARADAERWQKFASLPYKERCAWVQNLSLLPVLSEDIDKWIIDSNGTINKDAARYRWLRKRLHTDMGPKITCRWPDGTSVVFTPDACDEAIDAAMRQSEEGK